MHTHHYPHTTTTHLQASYSEQRSAALGNEPIVRALAELVRYEIALGNDPDAVSSSSSSSSSTKGPHGTVHNHASSYARAAMAVRGCSFRVEKDMGSAELAKAVPFLGRKLASLVLQVAASGSCEQLEALRADREVRGTDGRLRPGTDGACTRRM